MSDNKVDQRGRLDEEPFTFSKSKQGLVFIAWQGKRVMTLKGEAADKFLGQISGVSEKDLQLILAKCTGNFKRGNERY